jgi:HAD superfamily hydrolase (TIGR01662 family)
MIIFDLDQTLVDTSSVEHLRAARRWGDVMGKIATLPVYPGVENLLTGLSADGQRLAIVTRSPDMVAKWFIKNRAWPIEVVVGYHDVKRRKPDPEGLLLAMKRAGAKPEETLHIGDQAHDTEAARGAGVRAIGVTWGIADHTELAKSNPDHLFHAVEDLAAFLRS